MIDSNDTDRIEEAKIELENLLKQPELQDSVLLVLANKQDLPHAVKKLELAERLDLVRIASGRPFLVQETIATSGVGIYAALDWLARKINGISEHESILSKVS